MNKSAPRIGHGYDIHRLKKTGQLIVGGVLVAHDMSPVAHSDGDVAIHALVDAILGALGAGDIGQMFPSSDPQWKNAPSRIFLERAITRLRQAAYQIGNVDLTILAEQPRLAPFRSEICSTLAVLLGCDVSQVNVKAGTNEGCDAIGQGQAIASHAVVVLLPLSQ
ncbi:MAG TPA: 2-C-methyl-D-erythritol 2,4-cyclodiphosphate synthase [Tepidisphaeraceae bacterium]|jgi:2-C-methyl-D-erythritol 2,4-cyclodiphosphate synthase|nr:2-C-methyl-D-erythritol 2,4-cyclodiphosphate synthase [Tepidisphaeraceae bacterium]